MDIQQNQKGCWKKFSISRMHLLEIWSSKDGTDSEKCRKVFDEITKTLPNTERLKQVEETPELKIRVFYVCKKLSEMWKKNQRNKSKVINRHAAWLEQTESISFFKRTSKKNQSRPRGRPMKSFEECSKRSKRRRLAKLANCDDSAISTLREATGAECVEVDPDEALSLMVEAKLTKHQYLLIRNFVNVKTASIVFPSYQVILKSKEKCYPKNETVTETLAEITLQSLLDHTADRIVQSQPSISAEIRKYPTANVVLFGKWGFDGSSGYSEYKQSFKDPTREDSNLFVTSYVPLHMMIKPSPDTSVVLWKNPRPGSTRYCRPIRFQFCKETSQVSTAEEIHIKNQISQLKPTAVNCDPAFHVEHKLQLTMVDGKVCSALTETSSARCYICEATPTQMNNIDDCLLRKADENRYEFGLSPLHARIRFFEYFIHLAYRLDVKKWQIRSKEDKKSVATRKTLVQKLFQAELDLIIDKPRCGGSGNSNDGNTARKFFKCSKDAARITGLKQELIDRCGALLQCLTSGHEINVEEFREYALTTARLLVNEYPWYNLPATVHKVLVHGADIISSAILPIGELSEEAAEANNKNIKEFRRSNTRKISRVATNTDLLRRLLLYSDPTITGLRKIPTKRKEEMCADALKLVRI